MEEIKFSIIIPFYNSEDTLEKCLDSVVYQEYKNLEIIFIDNGSTDNSRNIVEKFCNDNSFSCKYLYDKNAGIGKLRNIGLANISGDYFLFLDSDDFYNPDLIKTLYKYIKKNKDVDIVRFNASRIEYKKTTTYELNKYKMQELKPSSPKKFFEVALEKKIEIGPLWLYCYNSNLYKKYKFKFLNSYVHEDLLNDYILCCAESIANIDFIGYNYVKNQKGITAKKDSKGELRRAKAIIKNYQYVSRLLFEILSNDLDFLKLRFDVFNEMLTYNLKYFEDDVLKYYQKQVDKCLKKFNIKYNRLIGESNAN